MKNCILESDQRSFLTAVKILTGYTSERQLKPKI